MTSSPDMYPAPLGDYWASEKINPTGGEPFGTHVTLWSEFWGNVRAVITNAPKRPEERGFLDSDHWGIHKADGGMMHVPGDMLTLGWHPDAK